MNTGIGERAVVVGCGVGGIFAAGALHRHFREVVVVDKDDLSSGPSFRKGVPQGPHGHIVLKRGENIAEAMFPGFRDALRTAGGIELVTGRDMARFAFGKWSEPLDSDMTVFSQTRPLLEHVLRECLRSIPNVTIRSGCRFSDFLFDDHRIHGVSILREGRIREEVEADLVIDASGRGTGTPRWLSENGFGEVETERLGIDLCYVTGIFATDRFEDGYARLCTVGQSPPAVRGGSALPVEGRRWMITLSGRGDDVPSVDPEAFLAFAKSLPDPCVYDRISEGRLEGSVRRFKTPESFWRKYESMADFPEGFVPIGDAVAGFNPIFGQGMSVAAVEAERLGLLLDERAESGRGLDGLREEALPGISASIAEAWEGPATIDYLYDSTVGERPVDYPIRRAVFFAMQEMAEEDPVLRQLQFEVGNMLKPREALFTAEVQARLQERLASAAGIEGNP